MMSCSDCNTTNTPRGQHTVNLTDAENMPTSAAAPQAVVKEFMYDRAILPLFYLYIYVSSIHRTRSLHTFFCSQLPVLHVLHCPSMCVVFFWGGGAVMGLDQNRAGENTCVDLNGHKSAPLLLHRGMLGVTPLWTLPALTASVDR